MSHSNAGQGLLESVLANVDTPLAVDLPAQICRIPRVLGEGGAICRWVESEMGQQGFDEVHLQEVFPDRCNAVGSITFGDGAGPAYLLTGHMDTKPVCRGWDDDPYSGKIVEDRIYGHG